MRLRRFNQTCEVAIIGGGPAGAALASGLARAGRKCLVIDQAKFPRYHVGELLVPHGYEVLTRLGLQDKFEAAGFPAQSSLRILSARNDQTFEFPFSEIFSGPQANCWRLNRAQFDQLLLDHAREAGAGCLQETYVDRVLFKAGRAIGVRAVPRKQEPFEVRASVVVDASGRGCLLGHQLGLKRQVPSLKKSALWSYYQRASGAGVPASSDSLILSLPEGRWAWHFPLSASVQSVGVVGSTGQLFAGTQNDEEILEREIGSCKPLAKLLDRSHRVGAVRGLMQLAYWNRPAVGDGWIMVGDARGFLDPLFSMGLNLGLSAAERASHRIEEALQSGDFSAARLGQDELILERAADELWRLLLAFYHPQFDFQTFLERFPLQRIGLLKLLAGDLFKDRPFLLAALAEITPPPVETDFLGLPAEENSSRSIHSSRT